MEPDSEDIPSVNCCFSRLSQNAKNIPTAKVREYIIIFNINIFSDPPLHRHDSPHIRGSEVCPRFSIGMAENSSEAWSQRSYVPINAQPGQEGPGTAMRLLH